MQRAGEQAAVGQADHQAEHGAEHRDQQRLEVDRAAHLLALHADRPQHPDLAAPFDHRQGQRVDDAEDRDDDRQAEQAVQQADQAVDLAGDRRP